MADPGFYGSYPYGISRYSQNKSTFFASSYTLGPVGFTGRVTRIMRFASSYTLGPVGFTGRVTRIMRFASSYTIGPVNFTGNVKRIQRIASSYSLGPVNFSGNIQKARLFGGQITISYSLTGNFSAIWKLAGVISPPTGILFTGDLFVTLYWTPITLDEGIWHDTAPVDAEWEAIAPPPSWN